jgi:5-methylcytosine-specific restriction endonuclease McrA
MYVEDQDWKTNVKKWVYERPPIGNDLAEDIENFFQKAFENTRYTNRSWFGLHNSGISLVIGGVYLAAIHFTGEDRGIWLLVERDHPQLTDIEFRPVKSTRRSEHFLVWAHSPKFSSVKSFIRSQDIWRSYSIASERIQSFPIAQDRDSVQKRRNKRRLSDIFTPNHIIQFEQNFSDAVVNSMQNSTEARRKRLSEAPIIPKQTEVKTVVFERNPDVVAEVLVRASGFCESCKEPAPFIRRSDNAPYLEVHHIKPLALGGMDSVDNAVALCPNCHRKAHYA